MRFTFIPSARSSRLPNHRSRRFISLHPVLLIVLVMIAALLAALSAARSRTPPTPSFAAKQDFATGANPFSVTVGDLNGDGKLDLAVANDGSNTVSVLLKSDN
jgi:hypothetical protein